MDSAIISNIESITASRKNDAVRVVIAGGGTGGHIFPALAIANALKKLNPMVEILFVGAKGKMEMEKIPEAGYKIIGIDIAGYNRSSLIKNISLPYKLLQSYFQVKKIIRSFKPQAVIGVGGYSSFPVLRLAQSANIPTFLHESNSLAGKSNIMLGKRATKIFVAGEGMEKYFPKEKIMITGNPVRSIFLNPVPKADALSFFGLMPGKKTVFVLGGSLGARSINETIEANAEVFKKHNLQLIWQTGKDFSGRAAKVEEESNSMWTNAFISKMEYAYAAADVVIARAGAMTIAELCVVKKAPIFVPFPFAAEDHQTVNASVLVNKGAAKLVPDGEVRGKLIPELLDLIKDENGIKEMESNISKLANAHADEVIAAAILENIK